jgi:hypothetical protein
VRISRVGPGRDGHHPGDRRDPVEDRSRTGDVHPQVRLAVPAAMASRNHCRSMVATGSSSPAIVTSTSSLSRDRLLPNVK